jgi:hypothetical protein
MSGSGGAEVKIPLLPDDNDSTSLRASGPSGWYASVWLNFGQWHYYLGLGVTPILRGTRDRKQAAIAKLNRASAALDIDWIEEVPSCAQ